MKKIIAAALMLAFAVTGCNKAESPETVVTKFFDALTATNYEQVNTYTDSPFFADLTTEETELYGKYFPSLSIANLKVVKQDSSLATVAVDITGMDVNAMLQQLIMDALTQMEQDPDMDRDAFLEEMDVRFKYMLDSPDAPVKTVTTEINLVMLNNGGKKQWALVSGPELAAAIFLEDPNAVSPMAQGEPEMEVIDTITDKATYMGSDEVAELCGFQIEDQFVYMYCDPEQIADLEANHLNKELEVTFDVLGDVTGMTPPLFVLVSHK